MSDEELRTKIDLQHARLYEPRHLLTAQYYHDELTRRENRKTAKLMLDFTEQMYIFTKQIRTMTVIILIGTLLSVMAAILTLLKA
jgi:hypothetical protein